ncbi:MAG: hypothetical protein AB1631_06675 [Acidobacteriota bacterium]
MKRSFSPLIASLALAASAAAQNRDASCFGAGSALIAATLLKRRRAS